MTAISSNSALSALRPFAASTLSLPLSQASGARRSGSEDPASLFGGALDPRAAKLMALTAAGPPKVQQATRVSELINEARAVADRARYSARTNATITGTEPDVSASTKIEMDPGDSITVSDGTGTASYIHSGGTVEDFLAAVNSMQDLDVTASVSPEKWLRLEATGLNPVTVGGSADDEELARIGLAAGTAVGSANLQRQDLARAFDAIRAKIDAAALDAGDGPITADSLGIRSASGAGFQSDDDIAAALADLDKADKALAERFAPRPDAARAAFPRAAAEVLSGGSSDLALADRDEASAIELARDLRAQLAGNRRSITEGAAVQVLRLF
jgi:hypothetical protein